MGAMSAARTAPARQNLPGNGIKMVESWRRRWANNSVKKRARDSAVQMAETRLRRW